jgi:hypothetical protein
MFVVKLDKTLNFKKAKEKLKDDSKLKDLVKIKGRKGVVHPKTTN